MMRLPSPRRPLAAAVLFFAATAHAQPAPGAVAAEALFREGRELMARGELAEACKKLEASERLDPAVGTLFSMGECYEGQARMASAWFAYREAVALAGRRDDRRRLEAQKRAGALEPALAHIVIRPPAGAGPRGIVLDGELVPSDAVGTPLPVDPGRHHVEARRTPAWARDVDVTANGATVDVPIPPPPVVREPVARRAAGIGLAVGGAALATTGAVFGLQAIVKGRDANRACTTGLGCSDANAVHENGIAKSYADVSTVLVPVGLALGVVGSYLLWTSRPAIEPAVSPTSARIDLRWSW